jgi:hypothetical protein
MRGAILGIVASAILIGPALAQGLAPQKGAPPQPTEAVPQGAIKPMRTHCYTNATDYAGSAPFDPAGNDWSCTVFWNNGANGHSNFTLRVGNPPNYENVRYNDTAACVPGLNGGSETANRYWIWVP